MNDGFCGTSVQHLIAAGKGPVEPDESWCATYLQAREVLPDVESFGACTAVRNGVVCGAPLRQYAKLDRAWTARDTRTTVFARCTRKKCQTYRSLRGASPFLTRFDRNEKCRNGLSLAKVMVMARCWVAGVPGRRAAHFTGRSHRTVLQWYARCRDVAAHCYGRLRRQLGGPGEVVRVDVTAFAADGGDKGPWVFGVHGAEARGAAAEWRYFAVNSTTAGLLMSVIAAEVRPGTEIRSERYLPLGDITALGYAHRAYEDDEDGYGGRGRLEAWWRDAKRRHRIQKNRDDESLVRSRFREEWWRSKYTRRTESATFDVFWDHVRFTDTDPTPNACDM